MERGEILSTLIHFPDTGPDGKNPPGVKKDPQEKFVVVVRAKPDELFAAVVVCSTRKPKDLHKKQRSFEVFVGTAEGFDAPTVIECRWVLTVQQRHLRSSKYPKQGDAVMDRISLALADAFNI